MQPTFQGHGDIVAIDKFTPVKEYAPGDVIVARSPTDPTGNICKRIIATQLQIIRDGDREIQVPAGHVWVQEFVSSHVSSMEASMSRYGAKEIVSLSLSCSLSTPAGGGVSAS